MLLPHPRVAGQVWVHSCCSLARLELALASREVTAIETDIIMASGVPIMAHPPARSSDLTFERFLDLVLADGAKHLKLDFKVFEAVEPCLLMLAEVEERLRRNEQAVWLNADVVAGPNHRRSTVKIPAANFLPLCRRLCPFALLSLGWVVAPIGPEEAYTSDDARRMARICLDHGIPGHQVVFSAALRFAELDASPIISLLRQLPDSQLILWTGTGEVPVRASAVDEMLCVLNDAGVADRTGFDVALASSMTHVAQSLAVDCTFWLSRTVRAFCCTCGVVPDDIWSRTGEREPLFDLEQAVASPRTSERSQCPGRKVARATATRPTRALGACELSLPSRDLPVAMDEAVGESDCRRSQGNTGSASGSSPRNVFALDRGLGAPK